jgi:hypothetical protein
MVLLLVLHLVVAFLAASEAEVGCHTVAGGECSAIALKQSACYKDSKNEKYREMMGRCCPECNKNSVCQCNSWTYDCLSHSSQHWSTHSGSVFPSTINLEPRPIHNSSFNLTISWADESTDASGYVVHVEGSSSSSLTSSNLRLGTFTTNQSVNTQLTLSNICFKKDKSYLIFKVWKKVSEGLKTLGETVLRRRDCYSLYEGDTALEHRYCGPNVSDTLDTSEVKISSKSEGGGLFSVTMSWPVVLQADSYDLKLSNETRYSYFSVTNTTKVMFSGLNTSIDYRVRIRPYMKCAGMYKNSKEWSPCAAAGTIKLTLDPNPPAPSPSPSSDRSYSPSSDRSSPIYASPTPNVTLQHSSNSAAIVGLALTLALTLALLLVLLATILVIIYLRRRKSIIKPAPSTTKTQLPSDKLKVLVLYSLETPEDEQTKINELLCGGLGQCGMRVETPGTVPNRQFDRERVEKAVVEANAVFFVCNDQFYTEWISEDSTAGCGGGAKIGRDVRMIKNAAGNSTLAKCAFVHFEASDEELVRRYPKIETAFITRYFSLSGDKLKAVQSIASFVKNIPKYELGTHCTVSDAP